ncbi:MAG TPA: PDZ domain-containing protein [Roseiflexaceae bacterium]|nr:PDZ domain-containing protein [Roseiflexaceae bacterium]HMP42505.1 PDZ domain-containing protein [Roseiflexaceae bacterium]
MQGQRRGWMIGAIFSAILLCIWCSFLSAVGGWVVGNDIALREARIMYQATVEARGQPLPDLGVLVTRLDRSGPAQLAGIERGDLIVAINGTHLRDPRDLRDQLMTFRAGESVRLTIIRDQGSERTIGVTLATSPNGGSMPYLGIYYTARADEPADL